MKKQVKKLKKPENKYSLIEEILDNGTINEVRHLFLFDKNTPDKEVLFLFRLWSRHFFYNFFHYKDAEFHLQIDQNNLNVYRAKQKVFLNIAYRGSAKTTRTKLFIAFCIANDADKTHRYIKHLTEDYNNAKQNVTDIYNLLINPRLNYYYPEIFEKTTQKREETMASFTTATGIKVRSDSVGTGQRGDIQDDARPSLIWFDDFETRKVLRSGVILASVWDNMEEAFTGLSKTGGALYTCNYISERGNVHRLVTKYRSQTLITPIKKDGKPTWEAYTMAEIDNIERNADDFAGEYLCEPSAGADIFFDRKRLDRMEKKEPIRDIAGFKIFHNYDASHRYGGGMDVAGGVGLDSSTSVFIDYSTVPARVVATFKNNNIKPDTFGDEIKSQGDRFGECIVAPESNNHGHATIGRLKQIYNNIYVQEEKETRASPDPRTKFFGWNTNMLTKPKMMFDLKKASDDGLLELSDPDLIMEARSYARDDLMDKEEDVRLTTRHFDLLIAAAIAWQMRNHATEKEGVSTYEQAPFERTGIE